MWGCSTAGEAFEASEMGLDSLALPEATSLMTGSDCVSNITALLT
jgi:2-keto-3-deoxy-6-phosphogluconate aldolase